MKRIIFLCFCFMCVMHLGAQTSNIESLIQEANEGNSSSYVSVVQYYYVDLKDNKTTWSWLENSNRYNLQGNELGYINFLKGVFYYNGYIVKEDYKAAIDYFKKSYESGFKIGTTALMLGACYQLGKGVKNHPEALKYYKIAADNGNTDAYLLIGYLYYYGGSGMKRDYPQAMVWFKQSAEQGNAAAMNMIGEMYWFGRGVKRNSELRNYWWQQAAVRGNERAKHHLEVMNVDVLGELSNTLNQAAQVFGNGGNNNSSKYEISTSSSSNTNGSVNDNSNSSSQSAKCAQCGGSGMCTGGTGASAKYHCHGTRKCIWCNGDGFNYVSGNKVTCERCKGNKKCTYCNGTGKCMACKGTGII